MSIQRQRRISLRQCALHNSYYAKKLQKSKREVSHLTERIQELEKENVRYREQVVNANKRADGILQIGFKKNTIKADITKLKNERVRLKGQIKHLEESIEQLKHIIRQIRIQDTNHQINKQHD